MSYTPQYTKPYANGYVDRPSKETPERASFINARDDTLIRIEKYLSTLNFDGKYALLTEAGYSLELSIDEYYVLTISLKNKAGTVISSKQIDFPIESMIINVDYNEDTGIITFNLQNGQSLEVNISTLVRGLVADTRTIAGIDLKDDITAEELKEALGYLTETDIAELNTSSAVAYYESKINTAITAPARTYTDMATITLPIGTYVVQSSFRSSEDGFRFYQGLQVEDEFLRDTRYDSMGIVASTWSTIVHLTKEMELIYKLWVDKEVVIDETQIRAVRINDNGGTEMAGTIKPWLYDISGEEVVVGVYNGKPIYRKYFTIHVTTTNGLYTQAITDLIPDYEEILNHKMYTTSGNLLNAIYANQGTLDTQDWMSYFVNVGGNIISISRSTSQPELDNDFSFMAEYTKTTDAEGSGNNLNPYGIYDAKLDDVKSSIASVRDEVDAVEEQLSDKVLPQYKNYSFPAEGWYRVAELSSTSTAEIRGAAPYILDLQINRTYANTPPESHRITIASNYTTVGATVEFTGEMSFAEGLMIPKIRVTADTSNNKAYVELYFRYLTIGNNVVLSLSNRMNSVPRAWTLINAVTTEESVEGITVLGIYEFSRNKSYKSEIKATDNTIIKYGNDTKEQALGYLNNPTTISAEWNDTRCYNFLFQDLVGDGPFNGGGIAEILGYTYGGGLYGFQMAFKYNMSPRWRQNLNGTWGEWVLLGRQSDIDAINSRLAYKAISGFINPGDTGCTASAYTENGLVHVYLTVPQGASGLISVSISDEAYYPRSPIGGTFASLSSSQDAGKLSGYATNVGKISIYASSALTATEALTFVYPLKSS